MSSARPLARIYTKRWCLYCVAARRLLRRLGVSVQEIPVDRDPALRARVAASVGGWPTVPLVFVGDTFVGGYRELRAAHRIGALEPLLAGDEL